MLCVGYSTPQGEQHLGIKDNFNEIGVNWRKNVHEIGGQHSASNRGEGSSSMPYGCVYDVVQPTQKCGGNTNRRFSVYSAKQCERGIL